MALAMGTSCGLPQPWRDFTAEVQAGYLMCATPSVNLISVSSLSGQWSFYRPCDINRV